MISACALRANTRSATVHVQRPRPPRRLSWSQPKPVLQREGVRSKRGERGAPRRTWKANDSAIVAEIVLGERRGARGRGVCEWL